MWIINMSCIVCMCMILIGPHCCCFEKSTTKFKFSTWPTWSNQIGFNECGTHEN